MTTPPLDDQKTQHDVFEKSVFRLSRQSVDKHFDAYGDVDWDADEMSISAEDPRFALWSFDPLASTEWYDEQPPEIRSRVGLHRVAAAMRIGWEFENVLQRGMLLYAFWLPNGRPEFRYIHHEVTEESQHTMMFQEVVDRSGLDVRGMPGSVKVLSHAPARALWRLLSVWDDDDRADGRRGDRDQDQGRPRAQDRDHDHDHDGDRIESRATGHRRPGRKADGQA